jgi:hypothetical protein
MFNENYSISSSFFKLIPYDTSDFDSYPIIYQLYPQNISIYKLIITNKHQHHLIREITRKHTSYQFPSQHALRNHHIFIPT